MRRILLPVMVMGAVAIASTSALPQGAISFLCREPQPPFITDQQVRQAPPLAEPKPRVPFRDPAFGTCMVRVTDRKADLSVDDGDSFAEKLAFQGDTLENLPTRQLNPT